MTAPVPVEKTLVNIDLSKGIDERSRPELMGGITTLDNLVCDQTGAWVKRPGHIDGPMSDTSGTGTDPIYPKKILNLITGWGIIADGGKLLHKQNEQVAFRTREQAMDFSVTSAAFAGSSGGRATLSIEDATSCSTHDAVIFRNHISSPVVAVCERSTGVEYVYDLTLVAYSSTPVTTLATSYRAVFVGDRYLHLYVDSGTIASVIYVVVIDVRSVMPASEAALTSDVVFTAPALAACIIYDALGGAADGWVLVNENVGNTTQLIATDGPTGTNTATEVMPAGHDYAAMDVNGVSNKLWMMVPGATTRFRAVDPTNINVDVVGTFTSANPGTYVSCNTTADTVKIVYYSTRTFGSGTVATVETLSMASGAVVTVVNGVAYGWVPASKPFFSDASGKHYIHLYKQSVDTVVGHVVADISTFTQFVTNTAALAVPFGTFRNSCNVEPFVGRAISPTRITSADGGYTFTVCLPYQTAARSYGIAFSRLSLNDSTAYGSANFSGATYLAHGGLNGYDGKNLVDQGYADLPVLDVVVTAVAGLPNGSYRYVAVYRYVDSNGTSTYSRTSLPAAAVSALFQITVTLSPTGVTNKYKSDGIGVTYVDVYRTATAGTQFYLVASSAGDAAGAGAVQINANATTGLLSFTDNIADATLITKATLFRQPGTTNAPADRYTAPACKFVIQHKDRLFCVDPYGQRVYYSSFFVDGEAAWFNPAFNFYVHAGSGPITGLASMDGRLFVFKRDVVFVVDGDGPGEAGPTGNEFSPPQALASRYGCVDHRSIVTTPQGIFYRSTRGFELINRQLKIDWIGERVQETAALYPVTTGACLGPDSRIHVTVVGSESASGVYDCGGVELVYDTAADAWSVGKYTGTYTGDYPAAMQNVGVINDGGVEKIAYAEEFIGTRIGDPTTGIDTGTNYVSWVVETGWIKQGPQARQRISGILLLAKKHAGANHAIRISLAYDYVDSYTQVLVWEPDVLNTLAIEELLLKPETQLVLAIRVKVEEIIPTDTGTYPVGTALGAQLLGITAEALPMPNAPFANRGVVGQLVFSPIVSGITPATGGTGGGTPVSIYGAGFSAATLITIGGAAVTSLVYVSPNLMTAVTPAGTVGAQDVVAINSGGTGTLSGGFTYAVVAFDPATFTANLWLKPNFDPVPNAWQSQPSDGASAWTGTFSNSGTAPAIGNINGYDCADFAPGDSLYGTEAHPQVLFTPSAGGIFVLLYPRNAAAYTGLGYDNPTVISNISGLFGISATGGGIGAWAFDGGFKTVAPIAAAASNWHLAYMGWDGVNLGLTVNSGAESTVGCGNLNLGAVFYGMFLGNNATLGDVFDGMIAEVVCFPYTPSVPDKANFKSYCNTKYGLAL